MKIVSDDGGKRSQNGWVFSSLMWRDTSSERGNIDATEEAETPDLSLTTPGEVIVAHLHYLVSGQQKMT